MRLIDFLTCSYPKMAEIMAEIIGRSCFHSARRRPLSPAQAQDSPAREFPSRLTRDPFLESEDELRNYLRNMALDGGNRSGGPRGDLALGLLERVDLESGTRWN